jgi:predicted transcriptional regulator
MKPASSTLTPQELEIMKVVWQKREATVRDVYEDLLERRKIAYTTVMTMMKVLEGKAPQAPDDRAYVYRPHVGPPSSGSHEFVDRLFDRLLSLDGAFGQDRRLTRRNSKMARTIEGLTAPELSLGNVWAWVLQVALAAPACSPSLLRMTSPRARLRQHCSSAGAHAAALGAGAGGGRFGSAIAPADHRPVARRWSAPASRRTPAAPSACQLPPCAAGLSDHRRQRLCSGCRGQVVLAGPRLFSWPDYASPPRRSIRARKR